MAIRYLIIFSLFSIGLLGQSKSGILESMALNDFKPANKNIWWLKDMKGYLDHIHPIRMVLATDNKIFKGAYELLNSGERFHLEGNFEGNEVVLIETDSLDRVTGYIKGDIIDDRFYAKWSDTKNFASYPIYVNSEPKIEVCGNLGWARYYTNVNIFQDSLVSIFISKEEDNYKATINYKYSSHKAILEPEDENGNQLRYVPEPFSGRDEMIIDLKNSAINFLRKKIRKPIQLQKKNEVILNCKSYFDFNHNIAYSYPILIDKKISDNIQDEIINRYMNTHKEVLKPHENFTIAQRAEHQELGYFRFNYLNDTMLSGVFFFQSSVHDEIMELPFNYVFKSRKEVKFNEGFIDKYNFSQDVVKYINEKIESEKIKSDFKAEQYSIFLLDKDGVKCKTPFHVINGDDEIIIPYAYFTSKIKKKSFYK
jgi:hypothetical protein